MAVPIRPTPDTDFTDYLVKLMERAGFERQDLARAADIDGSIVNRWFREKRIPTIENLRRIAPALNVTLPQLMVRAGMLTAPELGMAAMPQPPTPLPPQVREVMKILNSNEYSDREKRSLLSGIGRTLDGFHEAVEMSREAAERMNWGGRRAARTQR